MRLRTVIVDDEAPARQILRQYLADYPRFEIVAECADGLSAHERLFELRPDVAFVDVQMPGATGIELLESLAPDHLPARVVFSTAYDRFAVKAFELNAVDYLLKPFDRKRFDRTMQRLMTLEDSPGEVAGSLSALRSSELPAMKRVLIRGPHEVVALDLEEIHWIEAAGDYSKLHTARSAHLCSQGIGALEARLPGDRFRRIHRSTIVALDALQRLVPDGWGGFTAWLSSGVELKVSRSYAAGLKELVL